MRVFVCSRCFNSGGTMVNQGTHREPLYVHSPGQCRELNYEARNDIYGRNYPHFWGFLNNIGVDYNREERE